MKKFFQRSLPTVSQIKSHPSLQFCGKLLHDPNLWHLNRRSVAGATAVGLFTTFIPIPMQMVLAALLAILFRVNLPLAISLVWITNPITIPPIFYFAYILGTLLLRIPTHQYLEFNFSSEWLFTTLGLFWQPFLLGCLVLSVVSALTGYWLINFLWRLQVIRLWRDRHKKRFNQLNNVAVKNKPLNKLAN